MRIIRDMKDTIYTVTKLKLPFWARLAFLLGWPVEVRVRIPTTTPVEVAGAAETEVVVDRPRWLKRIWQERPGTVPDVEAPPPGLVSTVHRDQPDERALPTPPA